LILHAGEAFSINQLAFDTNGRNEGWPVVIAQHCTVQQDSLAIYLINQVLDHHHPLTSQLRHRRSRPNVTTSSFVFRSFDHEFCPIATPTTAVLAHPHIYLTTTLPHLSTPALLRSLHFHIAANHLSILLSVIILSSALSLSLPAADTMAQASALQIFTEEQIHLEM
jgi:hypothetical protein